LNFAEKRFAAGYVSKILDKGYNLTDQEKTDLVLKLYARDEKRPLLKFRNLIRRQSVQEMTVESLISITEGVMTKQEALELRKQVVLQAIDKNDLKAANTALDAFDDKLSLTPVKVTHQVSVSTKGTNYKQLLDQGEASVQQINTPQITRHNDKD